MKEQQSKQRKEQVQYWQSKQLDGLELLKAYFFEHEFAPHTHEGYGICSVHSGVQSFRWQGSVQHAPQNHLVLINPDEVHTGFASTPEGWRYYALYPSAQQVHDTLGIDTHKAFYFKHAVYFDPKLAKLIQAFHKADQQQMSKLELESRFTQIIRLLVEHYADHKLPHPYKHTKDLSNTRAFLKESPEQAVSLKTLASEAELSPYHFLRSFKKQFGITPHALQLNERVRLAKKQLKAGRSIAAVAAATGFADQSHLGRHFKRMTGTTPGQFAKSSFDSPSPNY